ncbi:MAG: hypothetical protein BMS9Abin34_010 [Patescibacteria group bacterium]|nr:MAG: hypothetical protein BMS9Abin34_010 [Patescibacteria group bacterium]
MINTDLHPFHFRSSPPLGGDLDAAFNPREIVGWVDRFGIFDRFVLGTHPPEFFRISTKLPPEEYLDAVGADIDSVRKFFRGRVFRGLECDLLIQPGGKVDFSPGETLLKCFDPEIALISFHFHSSLTYAGRFEMEVADLVTAFKWAINHGKFSVLAHPFDALERVLEGDPSGFEEIANLAREKRVAFEINADKGFWEKPLLKLIENRNIFSFGGDLHALSYWLKRDWAGLEVSEEDRPLVDKVLGLTREAADKEKEYWRVLDPMFWHLPHLSPRLLRFKRQAVWLYRRCISDRACFERNLSRLVARFSPQDGELVELYIRDLGEVYRKWGGGLKKRDRMRAEKYFLKASLTPSEFEVYERWLVRAFDFGLQSKRLINAWDTPKLEKFLHR